MTLSPSGSNIVDGFRKLGYRILAAGLLTGLIHHQILVIYLHHSSTFTMQVIHGAFSVNFLGLNLSYLTLQ